MSVEVAYYVQTIFPTMGQDNTEIVSKPLFCYNCYYIYIAIFATETISIIHTSQIFGAVFLMTKTRIFLISQD